MKKILSLLLVVFMLLPMFAILPVSAADAAAAADEVTHAALDDIANGKTAYIEVEATINQWYATNTFAGSVITSNVDREYQAVGFINVELANGANLVVYSAVTASDLATLTPEEA